MPYQRIGAMKISDHHVRSPLLNINRACQTCHRWPEEELRARVHAIQDRTFEVRNVAIDALLALIADIKAASRAGADEAALAPSRRHQRRAQFLVDFIEAENSMGFHADQEAMRILALSLDESRRGQASLPASPATPGARTYLPPPPPSSAPRAKPVRQEP
jgi:nitrite reductase (cytochrome c-552)